MRASLLRELPLVADLDWPALAAVASRCREVEAITGTRLTEQGDYGYKFFVILSGEVDVVDNGSRVARLGPGEFFGELALLTGRRRSATVVAASRVRLAEMMVWDFRELVEVIPVLSRRIQAAARVRLSSLARSADPV